MKIITSLSRALLIMLCSLSFSMTQRVFAQGGTWSTKSPMPTARYSFGVGVVGNAVYALGGMYDSSGNTLNTVEAYDPVTDAWTIRTSMPTRRSGLGVGVVNGLLYAVGGGTPSGPVTKVEAYNPATDSWSTKAPISSPRAALGVGVVNGILFTVGGGPGWPPLNTVEAYNPLTDSWTTKAPMPTARLNPGVGVINGILYAVAGNPVDSGVSRVVEAYNSATDAWTTKAPLPAELNNMAVGVVNGTLYVVGGADRNGVVSTAYAYDPQTDSWTTVKSMPTARTALAVGVVNGVMYAVGGVAASGSVGATSLASNEAFVPSGSQPTITTASPLPPGTVNGSYSLTLQATGGSAPYNWTLVSNSMPVGLTLSGGGTISGTPTVASTSTFRVRVTAVDGQTSEATLSLTINPSVQPPIITTQPQSQTVIVGQTAVFTVVASGSPAPNYQWQKNGAAISGATNATLTLTNLSVNQAGTYAVVVSNSVGLITSAGATLMVNVPLLKIVSEAMLPNQQFRLQVAGPSTGEFVIQASTNLVNWVALSNFSLTGGLREFIDVAAPNFSRRFYRVASAASSDHSEPETVSQIISAAGGGLIQLPKNGSSISIPRSSFDSNPTVSVSVLSLTPETEELFTETASIFEPGPRSDSLVVNTGSIAPRKEIVVKLKVSRNFLSSMGSMFAPQAYVQALWRSDDETIDYFEPIDAHFQSDTGEISANLPLWAYTSLRNVDGTYECILLIGSLPVPSTSALGLASVGRAREKVGTSAVEDSSLCSADLYSPLAGLVPTQVLKTVSSEAGERLDPQKPTELQNHAGIDFSLKKYRDLMGNPRALAPQIVPVADGSIIRIGWVHQLGQVVIVQHDGFQTLYAHLESGSLHLRDKNGVEVTYPKASTPNEKFPQTGANKWIDFTPGLVPVAGGLTPIGTMGTTGSRSTGPHLHLEYSRKDITQLLGKTRKGRLNSLPCIRLNPPVEGPLAVTPVKLVFIGDEGGSTPNGKGFSISNTGPLGTTLNYVVSVDAAWLGVDGPLISLGAGESASFTVSIRNFTDLKAGSYNAKITVTALGVSNSPQTVAVTLEVTRPATLAITKTGNGTGTVSLSPPGGTY